MSTHTFQEELALSKQAYEDLDRAIQGTHDIDPTTVRDQFQTLHTILLSLQRQAHYANARATAERDALQSEVHNELVDREANAARVADRQRFLFERTTALPGQANAYERAAQSAAFVEAAIVSLCPHTMQRSTGCEQLSQR